MSLYRVRKSWFGRLILQQYINGKWIDAQAHMFGTMWTFTVVKT